MLLVHDQVRSRRTGPKLGTVATCQVGKSDSAELRACNPKARVESQVLNKNKLRVKLTASTIVSGCAAVRHHGTHVRASKAEETHQLGIL